MYLFYLLKCSGIFQMAFKGFRLNLDILCVSLHDLRQVFFSTNSRAQNQHCPDVLLGVIQAFDQVWRPTDGWAFSAIPYIDLRFIP